MRKLVRSEEERRYRRDRDHERKWKRISDACEREMNAEVGKHMALGLDFESAWIAAGGMIIPLEITEGTS